MEKAAGDCMICVHVVKSQLTYSCYYYCNSRLFLVIRLTKGDVLAHTSHPSSASRQFVLELQSGHRVQMALAPRSVVTSGTKIVERFSNDAEVHHVLPQDCFFSGPVEGSAGHASFSLCEGELVR